MKLISFAKNLYRASGFSLKDTLVFIGVFAILFAWCFLLGIPFIYFGLDITNSNFGFFQKCLGMGFLATIGMVAFGSLIGLTVYTVKNMIKIWRES
jgi:hypothetical protein